MSVNLSNDMRIREAMRLLGPWQDIKDAPKDGRVVLIKHESDDRGLVVSLAYWGGGLERMDMWLCATGFIEDSDCVAFAPLQETPHV